MCIFQLRKENPIWPLLFDYTFLVRRKFIAFRFSFILPLILSSSWSCLRLDLIIYPTYLKPTKIKKWPLLADAVDRCNRLDKRKIENWQTKAIVYVRRAVNGIICEKKRRRRNNSSIVINYITSKALNQITVNEVLSIFALHSYSHFGIRSKEAAAGKK